MNPMQKPSNIALDMKRVGECDPDLSAFPVGDFLFGEV